MEIIKKEIELVQQIELDSKDVAIADLASLELALAGGGFGGVLFG